MSDDNVFEYKTDIIDGEPVALQFKPYRNAPGRISRHNIGQMERQVWLYLEWGLIEPKHWPVESDMPGTNVFDDMPQHEITSCYQAWQNADSGS